MEMRGKCIVLVSESGYSETQLPLLRQFIDKGVELFCAQGKQCEKWEEAMDWLCVQLDTSGEKPGAFCTTTCHPEESVEEVVQFAKNWNLHEGKQCDVQVVQI
ncbi:MAG: hypothetical protein PVI92_13455 [Chromatiales bacterium]|jgi:hypothetical protein